MLYKTLVIEDKNIYNLTQPFFFSFNLIFQLYSKVHILMISCQIVCSSLNTLFLILLCLFTCHFLCPKCLPQSYLPNEFILTFYDSTPPLNSFVRILLTWTHVLVPSTLSPFLIYLLTSTVVSR